METKISLEGIMSVGGNEDRALAFIDVTFNGILYHWQIFIPVGTTDLNAFLNSIIPKVESDISKKESEWALLDPKTRIIVDSIDGSETVVEIQKEEIVKPTIPDYYALRRNAYPSITDQIGALWKGFTDPDYITMQEKILSVKNQYTKE
jgi:hypothetical protein